MIEVSQDSIDGKLFFSYTDNQKYRKSREVQCLILLPCNWPNEAC
jgi:hypothetical protein